MSSHLIAEKINIISTYAKVHDPTPLVLNTSPDVTTP